MVQSSLSKREHIASTSHIDHDDQLLEPPLLQPYLARCCHGTALPWRHCHGALSSDVPRCWVICFHQSGHRLDYIQPWVEYFSILALSPTAGTLHKQRWRPIHYHRAIRWEISLWGYIELGGDRIPQSKERGGTKIYLADIMVAQQKADNLLSNF